MALTPTSLKEADIKKLFAASFLGKSIYAALNFLIIPLLANFLGIEALGLIGFYTTMLMVMMVLEGGMTSSLIHALSSMSSMSKDNLGKHVNTYLILFCVIGFLVTCGIVFTSGFLAENWLHPEGLSSEEMDSSIRLMAVLIGVNFPIIILQAVLTGEERQVELNCTFVSYALFRTFGVYFLLQLDSTGSEVSDYFSLLLLVHICYFIFLFFLCYKNTWSAIKFGNFDVRLVTKTFKFNSTIILISISSVVLIQYDKLYLSANIPLRQFSLYVVAASYAAFPYMFSSALQAVLFPRFTSYLSSNEIELMKTLFNKVFFLVTVAMSAAVVIAWKLSDILFGYFFDETISLEMVEIFNVLIIGTALQVVSMIGYCSQLAKKNVVIFLYINLIALPLVLFFVPVVYMKLGYESVAWIWTIYNAFSLLLSLYYINGQFFGVKVLLLKSILCSLVVGSLLWLL